MEYIRKLNPLEDPSVTGFICGGKNFFCVQESNQNRKIVFNSDLKEMINFCTDSISGCRNCVQTHLYEPQDIPTVEKQIRENLIEILQSGNIQPRDDSFYEITKLVEMHVLVKFPPIHCLGKSVENDSGYEYNSYIRLLVETAILCVRVLDYIKYGIKVVAERSYEEEFEEYKEKMKELFRWKNPQRIDELNLSMYTYCRLIRADITTVQELRELSEDEIARIKGVCGKSLQEIINMRELL